MCRVPVSLSGLSSDDYCYVLFRRTARAPPRHVTRLLGRLFLGRANQVRVAYAERLRQLVERDDRGIAATLLESADRLLAKAGDRCELLLGQVLHLPDVAP